MQDAKAGPVGHVPANLPANSPLPTGKLTFLFTDREGSATMMWVHYPAAMQGCAGAARRRGVWGRSTSPMGMSIADGVIAVFGMRPRPARTALVAAETIGAEVGAG